MDVVEPVILLMTYLIKHVFQKKTEDLNLSVFNKITGINEWKTLTKHISCECKCKLIVKNVVQIKSGIMKNVDVRV